ncbi:ATP synthase F1 subunit delta [bacterium]|nr:ATP synthase F1 subunit delta [bacterium]
MGNSKTSELVAKRWAKALIELTLEESGISKEDVLADVRSVAETINTSEELKTVISNPSVSTEEKQIVICKLFEGKVMPIVYNFLFVLNLRKRLSIIDEIADEFQKELEELKNIVRVDVTSAIDINEEKKEDIKNRISEKLEKDVIVDWTVDSDIIAGLVFNINDTVVDNSIQHKLSELCKKIIR